jgi:Na+-transporting NADH:ubiquinone oxidoreductase subunit D
MKIKSQSFRGLINPIFENNPISIQILGLCSALAITQTLRPALIMALAVIIILSFSTFIISVIRHYLPTSIRLILEITVIASGVIVVDEVIKTFAPAMSQTLSVFIALIVTNCIILGRVESFATSHSPGLSFIDGLGNGIGYALLIILIALVRELFGFGTILDFPVFDTVEQGGSFIKNQFMALPASAFFILGILTWILKGVLQASKKDD